MNGEDVIAIATTPQIAKQISRRANAFPAFLRLVHHAYGNLCCATTASEAAPVTGCDCWACEWAVHAQAALRLHRESNQVRI